ncbi:MAG: acetolactate synthase large subunit [Gammaproteobacteria bacterium]|jgi:acetolactate synthase-1/2/3 large subunit|nr:acetolactate synthase large subunit [Gammaproteobacteria bacterium]MBT3859718.1 acetolactate synthase large subunit [Gammaproteobacteria bacterium]MBT3987239.1 acetolactate synthase large subunit [Gammaproteobacteria bacterium]MBT4581569.1 acetolactate synthase large subunit [Gammaproteobacteria bacterium]MBT4659461.1 acetolactate synthase large subunit [Gammaproteobacteria bacterium]
MNGATALIKTLADCGVEYCIANPGTSEMHLVQALDAVPEIKSVLALYEGVCTGAADGIGRMTGKPAATLLHLGPGLANGIANLHNARRANSPIINIVGNHPNFHVGFDAPLTSDIDTLANNFSHWTKSCSTNGTLAQDGADAYTATLRQSTGSAGQISTLIMGADAAWGESSGPVTPNAIPQRSKVGESAIEQVASAINGGGKTILLLEHQASEQAAMQLASKIASKTGCRLFNGTFPGRVDGGPGRVAVERLPYFPEQLLATLDGTENLILVGGEIPASFFAYQGIPGQLIPEGCKVTRLTSIEEDAVDALERLAERLGAENEEIRNYEKTEISKPTGKLNTKGIAQSIAATLPEDVIVCTDSGGGNAAYPFCRNRVRHSWLSLTGGSIGQGGPCATGAALACPDRPVLALLGDGGAAYTNQSFWTQAREGLNVTTVIFANRSYKILNVEYARLGVTDVGEIAASLFDIGNPDINWVDMAKAFGVPGAEANTAEELCTLLENSFQTPGPFLIQANN